MYKIELLTDNHFIDSFDCGDEDKNKFLQKYALQNSKGGLGRTYVAVRPADNTKVYGYYTISSSAVKFENLPESRFFPRYPIPAILIGKLATDEETQKQGLGTALLFDALKRAAGVAEEVGIFLVEIKALNERAKKLYLKTGFVEMIDEPMKLYIGLKKVRKLLVELEKNKS